MKASKRAFLLLTAVAILLGACSSIPPRERAEKELQAYQQVAGEPVASIRFFGLQSWVSLGDAHLAIYTSPREIFLLTVDEPCNELPWAQAISVTSEASRVHAKFGHVIVGGERCRIRQIQPVDRDALKQARAQLSGAT